MRTTISLVRHGEVDNPKGIYYGRLPGYALSPHGRWQAAQAASHLSHNAVTTIYTSPLLRTRQTAAEISRLTQAPVMHTPHLLEVYTPFDGEVTMGELAARDFDLYTGTPPQFEQPPDILRRVQSFLENSLQQHAGEHIVGVTHGDVLLFTLMWLLGHPPNKVDKPHVEAFIEDEYVATASIVDIVFNGGGLTAVERFHYTVPYG